MNPIRSQEELDELAGRVRYVGSPYHKRHPGDFNLSPPAQPRQDKTLCDDAGVKERDVAQELLEEGARRGVVSDFDETGYPKHIWAVSADGTVFEAKYNNEGPGNYHGYPLFEPDRFREVVLKAWNST